MVAKSAVQSSGGAAGAGQALSIGAGHVVDNIYRVERLLGHDALGGVVTATNLRFKERVFLRFLRPAGPEHAERAARLLRAAQRAAGDENEHLPRVQEVGALGEGIPFIAFEYFEGRDLGARLREGVALRPSEAVEYVIHACAGLAGAHAAGEAHGDLKPENLFLVRRPDGSPLVKVLGSGAARLAPRGAQMPALDGPEGADAPPSLYSPPERLRPDGRRDARGDVWSLGALLFELLTARPAFPAGSLPELRAMVLEQPAPCASSFRPELPAGLDEAIGRCLTLDPAARFQNVAELAVALLPFAPRRASAVVEHSAAALGLALSRFAASAGAPSGSFLVASSAPRPPPASDIPPAPPAPASREPAEASSELKAQRRTLQIGTAVALTMIAAGMTGLVLERRATRQTAAPLTLADRAEEAPTTAPAAAPEAPAKAPAAAAEAPAKVGAEAAERADARPPAEAGRGAAPRAGAHKPRSARPAPPAGASGASPSADLEIRLKR
ncbi:MAG TPA: serine/threonine-protein kinase [Polyangiaceae bacterium]|nr:serine/threonine-protein kinase [Polyangiaceae bacterium]